MQSAVHSSVVHPHSPPIEIRHTQTYAIKAGLRMHLPSKYGQSSLLNSYTLITAYTHSGSPHNAVSVCLVSSTLLFCCEQGDMFSPIN